MAALFLLFAVIALMAAGGLLLELVFRAPFLLARAASALKPAPQRRARRNARAAWAA